VSTYTTLSITRVDGGKIDLIESGIICAVVGQHINLDSLHDGLGWDHDQAVGAHTVGQAGWNTYSVVGYSTAPEDTSKHLGPDYRLTTDEEYDDEGPGGESNTYVNGERDVVTSTTLRPVSIALSGIDLADPDTVSRIRAALIQEPTHAHA